jgi:hypothetical protein
MLHELKYDWRLGVSYIVERMYTDTVSRLNTFCQKSCDQLLDEIFCSTTSDLLRDIVGINEDLEL